MPGSVCPVPMVPAICQQAGAVLVLKVSVKTVKAVRVTQPSRLIYISISFLISHILVYLVS